MAPDNGLRVASLLDLAGTKASVVQMRAEARDYIDIDALLTDGTIDLPTALAAARAIYGLNFNPQSTLKALSYFDDGNLRRLPAPVKDRLAKAAREVDLDRLPVVAAPARATDHAPGLSR
ncbi:MAG: nucleotidyl transferase AbiEii/AbiGii toxin family protein [Acetobacteraceae bacterium]